MKFIRYIFNRYSPYAMKTGINWNKNYEDMINEIALALDLAVRKEMDEHISRLKQLSDDAMNACTDKPEHQLTWNSALRQMAYKLDAEAKAIRQRGEGVDQ